MSQGLANTRTQFGQVLDLQTEKLSQVTRHFLPHIKLFSTKAYIFASFVSTTSTMTITHAATAFSQEGFLNDIRKTAAAINAPYSEPAVREVLKAFEECFAEDAVLWRTTNRPNDKLNYRISARGRLDTVAVAVKAGFIKPDNQLARLINSWSSLYGGDTEHWCDFDAAMAGIAKTWVDLKDQRPLDDILNADQVPDAVRAHGSTLHSLGLETVRFVAVDYHGNSMNLYFGAPGPITRDQAAKFVNLVQCPPPTEQEFQDMRTYLNPEGYPFAVTIDHTTGTIRRVAFYAINLPEQKMPMTVNDRMLKFFDVAPSYDLEPCRIVAWSFGLGGSKYLKAESSYLGEVGTLLRSM